MRGQSYIRGDALFDGPTVAISKYVVTDAQYAKFIEADGYKQRKWWTVAHGQNPVIGTTPYGMEMSNLLSAFLGMRVLLFVVGGLFSLAAGTFQCPVRMTPTAYC
jgi:hypothetical protein